MINRSTYSVPDCNNSLFKNHSNRCNRQLGPRLVSKIFQDFMSHRMFGHMHRALNVDKKN
jgi:hypothetical protein